MPPSVKFLDRNPLSYLKKCEEPWIKNYLSKSYGTLTREKYQTHIAKHPKISEIIKETRIWPGQTPLKRKKNEDHLIHKIAFLADLGLNKKDENIKEIGERILSNQSENGMFRTLHKYPEAWAEKKDQSMEWILCDAASLLYSLLSFGFRNKQTNEAVRELIWLSDINGWRCKSSNPSLKGPGKKNQYCPYSNLLSLKALSVTQDLTYSEECLRGIEALLEHWTYRSSQKIRGFGIGSTFMKLRYPNIWYDILHVVDVLSRYDSALEDDRFLEMWEVVRSKQNPDGSFTPEKIWRTWESWSFGQKTMPSPWLTCRIDEINNRIRIHHDP